MNYDIKGKHLVPWAILLSKWSSVSKNDIFLEQTEVLDILFNKKRKEMKIKESIFRLISMILNTLCCVQC